VSLAEAARSSRTFRKPTSLRLVDAASKEAPALDDSWRHRGHPPLRVPRESDVDVVVRLRSRAAFGLDFAACHLTRLVDDPYEASSSSGPGVALSRSARSDDAQERPAASTMGDDLAMVLGITRALGSGASAQAHKWAEP